MAVARALVVGIGNPLRGDDGAGAAVADAVGRRLPGARVVAVQQLVPELAEDLSQADVVAFVDASRGADTVTVRDVAPHGGAGHSHVASPAALLTLCREAYGVLPRTAWLVEVPASCFDLGTGLSARTRQGVEEAAQAVARLLGG